MPLLISFVDWWVLFVKLPTRHLLQVTTLISKTLIKERQRAVFPALEI